jgi:hypothetical protein
MKLIPANGIAANAVDSFRQVITRPVVPSSSPVGFIKICHL